MAEEAAAAAKSSSPAAWPVAKAEAAPAPTSDSAPKVKGEAAAAAAAAAAGVGMGDGRTFSQLLAGAMASPKAGSGPHAAAPPPILTVPVMAVPCFLAPAALIESSGFKGQFAMTHQAALASVTAQAQLQLQALNSQPSSLPHPILPTVSPAQLQQRSPSITDENSSTPKSEKPPLSEQKPQSTPALVSNTTTDGFNWRKYGQKQVKSSENSRSYYRCTTTSCSAKKKIERCPDGRVVEIVYRGGHNHEAPQKTRYPKERGPPSSGPSGDNETLQVPNKEANESETTTCKTEQNVGSETPEQQLYCSSDCEGDPGSKNEEDLSEEPEPKRRMTESVATNPAPALKAVREPKVIVQTAYDVGHVTDGYRWRKYGQKIVKGNPNPRSYYRCTHDGCPVRKHVERASDDAKSIVITYEGKHNHEQPAFSCNDSKGSPRPSITAKGEQPNAPNAASDCEPPKDSLPHVDAESNGNKAIELGGEKALESAQTLLSIRTNPDGIKKPHFGENSPPVAVQNT
ncbi:probable WRKY transcription factor 3 [Ananas comosus]|nr:probable WRKY transcription factor 3 [Ananas comosus]